MFERKRGRDNIQRVDLAVFEFAPNKHVEDPNWSLLKYVKLGPEKSELVPGRSNAHSSASAACVCDFRSKLVLGDEVDREHAISAWVSAKGMDFVAKYTVAG